MFVSIVSRLSIFYFIKIIIRFFLVLNSNAKQALWIVLWSLGCIPMSNSFASLRLRLGELFNSDPFGILRPMIGYRDFDRESTSRAWYRSIFSIAGQYKPHMCVTATLGVPQFVDSGTFLVFLGTFKKH